MSLWISSSLQSQTCLLRSWAWPLCLWEAWSLAAWSCRPECEESFSCELERWPLLVGLDLGLAAFTGTCTSLCRFLSWLTIASSWSVLTGTDLLAVLLVFVFLTSVLSTGFSFSLCVGITAGVAFFCLVTDSEELVFCGFCLVEESDVASLSLFRGFFNSFFVWMAGTFTSSLYLICERLSTGKSLTGLGFFLSFASKVCWPLCCSLAPLCWSFMPVWRDDAEADFTFPAFATAFLSTLDASVILGVSLMSLFCFSFFCLISVLSTLLFVALTFAFTGFVALSTCLADAKPFGTFFPPSLRLFFSVLTCSGLGELSFVTFLGCFPGSLFESRSDVFFG